MNCADTSFLISLYGSDVNSASAQAHAAARTEVGGHRSYDIIHVAAAKLPGATDFWSFDERQRRLAQDEGMNVGP